MTKQTQTIQNLLNWVTIYNLNAEPTRKKQIEHSEIPAVRRDEPKAVARRRDIVFVQNKAKILYFQPKNQHCKKTKPIQTHFLGSWVLAFLDSCAVLQNKAKLKRFQPPLTSAA
jgi:hypothetical protein